MSVQPCVGIWNLVDRLTCGVLAENPLVWLSICTCVELVAKTEIRTVVFRKMSGHGAGVVILAVLPALMILG